MYVGKLQVQLHFEHFNPTFPSLISVRSSTLIIITLKLNENLTMHFTCLLVPLKSLNLGVIFSLAFKVT